MKAAKVWKKGDKIMLSVKNLVFKKKLAKKLTKRYTGPYIVKKVVLKNMVKLKLPVSIKIYLVMNISKVMRYINCSSNCF